MTKWLSTYWALYRCNLLNLLLLPICVLVKTWISSNSSCESTLVNARFSLTFERKSMTHHDEWWSCSFNRLENHSFIMGSGCNIFMSVIHCKSMDFTLWISSNNFNCRLTLTTRKSSHGSLFNSCCKVRSRVWCDRMYCLLSWIWCGVEKVAGQSCEISDGSVGVVGGEMGRGWKRAGSLERSVVMDDWKKALLSCVIFFNKQLWIDWVRS